MSKNQDTLKDKIYNYLKGLGYEPEMLSSNGKEVPVIEEADIFRFTFQKDGESYGTAYVSIDNSNVLTVYQSDELQNSPDEMTGDPSWEQVRLQLRKMSFPLGIKSFDVRNKNHLENDMAKREYNKKLDEGYYPMGKKASYSDNIPETKMIIQHTRNIEEGEQRYRNVARIFVENMNGERFLLPTTKPGIGRVYARHIAEGGTPYDERGQHITSLVEEYSKMAGFVRATRNGQFNESAQRLVTEGVNHYQKLRETLHKLTGKKGYSTYFESYTPPLMEDEEQKDLSEMFMSSSLDPRIECVMPILSKLSKNITEDNMKEIKSLEEWAEGIAESSLNEFAPSENPGGNSGDAYIRTLASAWYNQDLSAIADQVKKDKNPKKKGIMDRVIDAQRAVEKILERGIVCGDGKVRKFYIDYNSDFDGVRIVYEDYSEYSDYDDDGNDIDSRTGKPWPHSKYDDMEFKDDELNEGIAEGSLNEFAPGDGDDGEEDTLQKYARMWYNGDDATQQKIEKILDRMGWEIGELESEEGGCFVVRAGDSYIKGSFTLDYEFIKKNHLNLSANYANIEDNLFNSTKWISTPKYSGYALGYGLETIVGPVEFKYTWSPETGRGYAWFNVGFWF